MNINVTIAARNLKKWSASLKPIRIKPVLLAKAGTPKRRSLLLRLWVAPVVKAMCPVAVAAARAGASLELDKNQTGRGPVFLLTHHPPHSIFSPVHRSRFAQNGQSGHFSPIG
jgi:hypothetical protein